MSENKLMRATQLGFLVAATKNRMRTVDRRRLHAIALNHARRKTWAINAVLFLVFALLAVGDFDVAMVHQLGLHPTMANFVVLLSLVAVNFTGFIVLKRQERGIRSYLRRALYVKRIRPHFCLKCDYNLQGVVSDACPECGAQLAPLEVQEEFNDEDFAPVESY